MAKTNFAEKLKKLRVQKGWTMQALADEAKVSKSMISKIESDEVHPTLDVAGRLATALGKTLSEMLHAKQKTNIIFLPKEQQAVWEDAQHIRRQNISPVFEGLKIEWLLVTLPPKSEFQGPSITTIGAEKYILVVKGALKMKIAEKMYLINKGDSIYFDASYEHVFINATKNNVEYYIIIKYN